jgi:hypothetical protein
LSLTCATFGVEDMTQTLPQGAIARARATPGSGALVACRRGGHVGPNLSVLTRLASWPSATADVDERLVRRRPGDLLEQLAVDAPGAARPVLSRQGDGGLEVRQLPRVDQVGLRSRGVEKAGGQVASDRAVVAEHRPQRNHARAAADEEERPTERLLPHEVAADGATQLEVVSGLDGLRQVRRDLAVVESFDGEDEVLVLGRRGDRVAALSLVAVLGGEPHVHMLAGPMTGPVCGLQDQAGRARVLADESDDARGLPGQSPAYRCSCHGSP